MASRKAQKKVEKYIKKLPLGSKVIATLSLIIALLASFVITLTIQKNDCFELVGEKKITLFVGGSYHEPEINEAINIIAFGKDASSSVYINLDESTYDEDNSILKAGTYYIVYETSNFKYSSIKRIRTIEVNEIDIREDSEEENQNG